MNVIRKSAVLLAGAAVMLGSLVVDVQAAGRASGGGASACYYCAPPPPAPVSKFNSPAASRSNSTSATHSTTGP
jgi:hypothetical protein